MFGLVVVHIVMISSRLISSIVLSSPGLRADEVLIF